MMLRRVRRLLACRLALYSDRALALLECSTPLATLAYTAATPSAVLVIFLPGIGDFAEDFESRGFIEALMQSPLRADAMAVDAHYGYYGRRTVLERLAQDVVLPARPRYREVWLVGISMGGMGALSYVAQHPEHIARALLLAPYLGDADDARAHVRRLWRWIRDHQREQAVRPRLYLGYGSGDRFAAANALFASHLPPGHVLTLTGGHDWRTWRRLWQSFLSMWTVR